jgi:hypothetical protein
VNRPAAQGTGAVTPGGQYKPAGQLAGRLVVDGQYAPLGHRVQLALPKVDAYVPGTQGDWPVAKCAKPNNSSGTVNARKMDIIDDWAETDTAEWLNASDAVSE